MRRIASRCALLALAGLSLSACASTGGASGVASGGMSLVRETYTATSNGMGAAVTAPLRDFNVVRQEVPDILRIARDNPYAVPERLDCPGLRFEIARYDLVLGPDLDVPSDPTDRSIYARGAEAVSGAALDAVRDATTGWIPFRSVVRRLTGAEQADRDFRAAVLAGTIRRAYLKGLGETHGCTSPAAPMRIVRASGEDQAAAPPPPRASAGPAVPQ